MHRRTRGMVGGTAAAAALLFVLVMAAVPARAAEALPKNVIVLIADGAGPAHYTLARWAKGGPLALDPYLRGMLRTPIANSVIADSAPAATALATGQVGGGRSISTAPEEVVIPGWPEDAAASPYRPLATVLEGARLLGKSTGVVATCRLAHATPGAYLAHAATRKEMDDIMEQAVFQGVTVALAGGMGDLSPKEAGGRRGDGQDLARVLKERGYRLAGNSRELAEAQGGPLFGLFAPGHMSPEIDRPRRAPGEPGLDEMTQKALELLSADPDGFFLMVEASQVDWAGHANDPAYLLGEMAMYDKTAQVLLDFAHRDGRTLLLAVSDHSTGGLSIGNYANEMTYKETSLESLLDPLRRMRASAMVLWKMAGPRQTPESIKRVVSEMWGVDLTDEETREILAISRKHETYGNRFLPDWGIGQVVCRDHTQLGWTTHGHTGEDVPVYALGPLAPSGVWDEPGLGCLTARALGLDLAALNRRLFAEAGEAFAPGDWKVDLSDPANPVLRVNHKGGAASLEANRNVLILDGRERLLEGVAVHIAENGKFYLPLEAVNLITGSLTPLPSPLAPGL